MTINFSPQHYTVKEGDPVELIIALQEPSARSITFNVSTMDGTANCKWKVFLHRNIMGNNGVTDFFLFLLQMIASIPL